MSDFMAMGGYGMYIWGAYGISALAIFGEVIVLRGRTRAARMAASAAPIDDSEMANAPRTGYTTAGGTQ